MSFRLFNSLLAGSGPARPPFLHGSWLTHDVLLFIQIFNLIDLSIFIVRIPSYNI